MLEELKHTVWQANLTLQRSGLVILTWGNASGYDPESGLVVIKPSGVDYAALRPEEMAVVNLDGRMVEGALKPSSDAATHLLLYRAFPRLRGVAHTHSTYATAWAQAKRPLPCYGTTHADTFRGAVPVTADLSEEALAGHYEAETGEAITRAFTDISPYEMPGVLVASHGPFTWGSSAGAAVENSIILEEVAYLAFLTEQLNAEVKPIRATLQDKHFLRKHGANAYYGQNT